jgi:nicotinamidase-related amidase
MRKTIESLTAADFAKWVRKQVRQFGRKAEICNQQYSAVEMWLRELGFVVSFICGGEVEVDGEWYVSDFQTIGYYMMDEDGMMEEKAGRWLDIVSLENLDGYLIAR